MVSCNKAVSWVWTYQLTESTDLGLDLLSRLSLPGYSGATAIPNLSPTLSILRNASSQLLDISRHQATPAFSITPCHATVSTTSPITHRFHDQSEPELNLHWIKEVQTSDLPPSTYATNSEWAQEMSPLLQATFSLSVLVLSFCFCFKSLYPADESLSVLQVCPPPQQVILQS